MDYASCSMLHTAFILQLIPFVSRVSNHSGLLDWPLESMLTFWFKMLPDTRYDMIRPTLHKPYVFMILK